MASIHAAGGTVWYDWVSVGAWHDIPLSECADRVGVDYVVNVFMASLRDQGSDKHLDEIAQLSRLEKLDL